MKCQFSIISIVIIRSYYKNKIDSFYDSLYSMQEMWIESANFSHSYLDSVTSWQQYIVNDMAIAHIVAFFITLQTFKCKYKLKK